MDASTILSGAISTNNVPRMAEASDKTNGKAETSPQPPKKETQTMAAKKKASASAAPKMKPILPIRGIINELGMKDQIQEGKPLSPKVKTAVLKYLTDKVNAYTPGTRGPSGPRIQQEEIDATVEAVKAALDSLPGSPKEVPIQAIVYPYMSQADAPKAEDYETALAWIRKIGKPAVNPKTGKSTKRQESFKLESNGPTTAVKWIG